MTAASENNSHAPGALEGIRVLDASQMLAGPHCAMRLGDMGADVLKIEPPHGEWTRSHGIANATVGGESTPLMGLNRNKRSVTLNLKHPDGLEALYRLVEKSDVFLQNYRVGVVDRLKVDYHTLSQINPNLIYCSITGYGESGPYRSRPGQDLVVQGYSGSMYSVGSRHDPPRPGPIYIADVMAAYQATMAILAALIARGRVGKGQKIEVSMLASLLDAQAQEMSTFLNLGILPPRTEMPFANAWINAPYGVYKTADGYITLAMAPLHVLGEALDDDTLRGMTEWSDGATRRDEVYPIVEAKLPAKTTAEWIAIFDQHNIWAGPVYNYADVDRDPHVIETGMIATIQHPKAPELRMPNVPNRYSVTPEAIRLPPPMLSEHTGAVLGELLGYNTAKIEQMKADGAA